MPPSPSVPEQLRTLRTTLKLTSEELATRLGVSAATMDRWKAGTSSPRGAQFAAIEALLSETDPAANADVRATRATPETPPARGSQATLGMKSMEQMLWGAACSIRGEKDAPKFKDYLLPLLFVKRLSDVFDDEIVRLTTIYGDRTTALDVLEADHRLVRFYLPPEARWGTVSGRGTFAWPDGRRPATLGEQLTSAIRAIVRHNPALAGVIDIVDFNETRNGEREISDAALKGIVEAFSDPRYRLGLEDVEPDFLGRCYEFLLRKFAEGQGQSAGEFFTPTEVGFLMAEILKPAPGETCYDYACGSCGLLIKLQLVAKHHHPDSKVPVRLFGQEREPDNYAIGVINKTLHDMEGEIVRGDSMQNPRFRESDGSLTRFDVVVANPMWNQSFDSAFFEHDPFDRFLPRGGITSGKGDWAWLQHTLATLKDDGRAAVVLDTGAMTRGSGGKNEDKERAVRRWFVEHDLIDGVILLPDNLFYNTPAAGVIVVLRQQKPSERRGKIVLVNAGREFQKGNPKNFMTDDHIRNVAEVYIAGEAVADLCAVITNEDAAGNDFNLSPSRYLAAPSTATFRDLAAIARDLEAVEIEAARSSAEVRGILNQLL